MDNCIAIKSLIKTENSNFTHGVFVADFNFKEMKFIKSIQDEFLHQHISTKAGAEVPSTVNLIFTNKTFFSYA